MELLIYFLKLALQSRGTRLLSGEIRNKDEPDVPSGNSTRESVPDRDLYDYIGDVWFRFLSTLPVRHTKCI